MDLRTLLCNSSLSLHGPRFPSLAFSGRGERLKFPSLALLIKTHHANRAAKHVLLSAEKAENFLLAMVPVTSTIVTVTEETCQARNNSRPEGSPRKKFGALTRHYIVRGTRDRTRSCMVVIKCARGQDPLHLPMTLLLGALELLKQ
eukprot:3295444-Rhodomonas_salina.1